MGRQVRFEPGQILFQESWIPETVQFLLSGFLEVTGPDGTTRRLEAPAVLAFQEVLEEWPMAKSIQTAEKTLCLALTGEEILTLLADNRNLLPGIFRVGQGLCKTMPQPLALLGGPEVCSRRKL